MSLIPCPGCLAAISDAAAECPHCRRRAVAVAAPPREAAYFGLRGMAVEGGFTAETPAAPVPSVDTVITGELHPLAIHKLLLLDVLTLGLYKIFWFYRNWVRVRERTRQSLNPFWRSFFAPLWAFSFFEEVRRQARDAGVVVGWSPLALAILYVGFRFL
jgi:hypothetical protein